MISGEDNRIQSIKRDTVCILVLLTFFIFLSICFIGTAAAQEAAQSGYSLIGTIQSSDLTGAVIAVAKGEQSFFRKFDKLPDGSQIVEVRSDSIKLRGVDGVLYDIYILHDMKTVASANPTVSADLGTPGAVTQNMGAEQNNPHQRRRARHSRSGEDREQ